MSSRRRSPLDWLDELVYRGVVYTRAPHRLRTKSMTDAPQAAGRGLRHRTTGLLFALLAPVAAGAALIPLRNTITNTNAALILVVVVVLAAIIGERPAAAVSAVTAALAFDVLLTRPYYRPTIHAADDVETTVILLIVGLLVGQLVVRGAQLSATATRRADELGSVQAVLHAALKADQANLVIVTEQQLTTLLGLRECRWSPGYRGEANPVLQADGTVRAHAERRPRLAARLPPTLELPVRSGGRELGRFILRAESGAPVSLEERLVALEIAEVFGASVGLS